MEKYKQERYQVSGRELIFLVGLLKLQEGTNPIRSDHSCIYARCAFTSNAYTLNIEQIDLIIEDLFKFLD